MTEPEIDAIMANVMRTLDIGGATFMAKCAMKDDNFEQQIRRTVKNYISTTGWDGMEIAASLFRRLALEISAQRHREMVEAASERDDEDED